VNVLNFLLYQAMLKIHSIELDSFHSLGQICLQVLAGLSRTACMTLLNNAEDCHYVSAVSLLRIGAGASSDWLQLTVCAETTHRSAQAVQVVSEHLVSIK